jgi:hypothetical protein
MKKLLFLFILMLSPMLASANDGDTFSEETVEGVLLNYTIISESEKTCMVGYKQYPEVPTARDRRGPEKDVSKASGDITIPEVAKGYRVIQIETSAFEQAAITSVFIPNSVKTIGSYAFQRCVDLKSVRLSKQLTRIAGYTFYGCKSLTSIDIPEGVTSIGDYAFAGCEQLKEITIPSSVEQFGGNVFCNTGFTSLPKLPESLTVIPKSMFYECTQLTSIEIPENITMIDECAFCRCPISEIKIPASVTNVGVAAFANCKNITDLTIPDNVTEIGFNAFNGCSNLKTVKLSANITSLNQGIFTECSSLESIIIPNGVKSIGKFAFMYCSSLGSINLPETLEEIGEQAFFGCSSLKQLFIPKNFVRFKKDENNTYWSFIYGCTSLTSVVVDEDNPVFDSRDNCNAIIETASNTLVAGCITTKIPEGITAIGFWAFGGFHDLTSITLPHSLNRIEQSAFNGSGLREITIPENVSYIGAFAFSSCNSLKDFYCCAEKVPKAESSAFGNTNLKEVTLHVPAESVDAYQATEPWSNFKKIVALSAQDDYHPLIEEGKIWNYHYHGLNGREFNVDRIIDGDTIIGGLAYKKIYDTIGGQYQYALREEGKKIYIVYPHYETASLLYDFSKNAGDVINELAHPLIVASVDTIDIDGVKFRRMRVQDADQPVEEWNDDLIHLYNFWIEGVGSESLLEASIREPGNYYNLLSCQINGRVYTQQELLGIVGKPTPQNDYLPFVESGKIWHVVRSQTGYLNYHFNQYTLMNEEVVKEGKTYLKMYRSEDGKDVAYDEGLYREEDRRVYVYDEKDGREYMLYDFSLKEGDTFTYEYGFAKPVNCKVLKQGWLDDGPKIVTSRTLTPDGTMESKYRQLRTWTIGREDDSGVYYEWGTWVEGVGVPEEMFKKLGADGVMSCLAYIERDGNKCDYSENAYLPFSFYDYWGPVQGFNLPKGAADYSESDGHHQLTYELEGDRLHVHGKVFTQCGPNSYAYFIAEPIDNSPVIKLRFEIQEVEPLADCMGLFDIDFYVPGFELDFGYLTINAVVDNQGVEHPVIKKTQQDMPYRPMIEDGKVWKVGSTMIRDNLVKFVGYYYFDGDTIIGGKTCKKMMRQRYVTPDYPDYAIVMQYPLLEYMGAWYEEDKKVYFYNAKGNKTMMYDFSLDTDDTFYINGYGPYGIGPKQTGGLEGFKGVYRDLLWYVGGSRCTTWLEGVGGIDGPTENVYYGYENHAIFLMSCTVGDEVIYLNDDYEDVATPAEARKRRFDFTHTIKIQPKARHKRGAEVEQSIYGEYNDLQLGINLDPLDDAYMVRITDESGKAVYEKNVNTGNIVGLNIDISNYAEGRYTVTVENSLESFTGEFEAQPTGIKEVRSKKVEVRDYIYNLQGQRISTLQKGLNIVNGQKVFVK